MHLTALLTCHNRKAKTVEALSALFSCHLGSEVRLDAILVDDGSTDGTAAAVEACFPQVHVEFGDGNLFWCRGMHLAQLCAIRGSPDFLLWLNDDTVLAEAALSKLLLVHANEKRSTGRDVVVVGATVDPETRRLTYGGLRARSWLRRFSYSALPLSDEPQECDAMNGNVVLVPKRVYERVGSFDPQFEHALGDIDYGLRARRAGFRVMIAPGIQGTCAANGTKGSFLDSALPVADRWSRFTGRKGLPPASWAHFVRRHAGVLWPAYFAYPYARFLARLLFQILAERRLARDG
jgi:GT2 family glycosyltransferase